MSAINQMLRDLDKRSARAHADTVPGERPAAAAAPDVVPNRHAGAYAGVRMMGPRTRWSRNLLLAGGVAVLLPIAWATTTYLDRPVSAHLPSCGFALPANQWFFARQINEPKLHLKATRIRRDSADGHGLCTFC